MVIPSQYGPVIMVCERGFFLHLKVYENEFLLYHIVMHKFKDKGLEVGEEPPRNELCRESTPAPFSVNDIPGRAVIGLPSASTDLNLLQVNFAIQTQHPHLEVMNT